MNVCKSLLRTSLTSLECSLGSTRATSFSISFRPLASFSAFSSLLSHPQGLRIVPYTAPSRSYASSTEGAAISIEATDFLDQTFSTNPTLEPGDEGLSTDTVEHLLSNPDDVAGLMKMERRPINLDGGESLRSNRWFPYLDRFRCGTGEYLSSGEVLEALSPHILDVRKERFRNVARNRSYSVCLVVEGLCDFGNVSATLRSADALGFQSVHVVSRDSKRYRDNRHVSKGAEKWLDIELWNSTPECFSILKSRGYRIATTHVGMDADWMERRPINLDGGESLRSNRFSRTSTGDEGLSTDTVEHLLSNPDDVAGLMKMERRPINLDGGESLRSNRWFPYLDRFRCGTGEYLSSGEVLEALSPHILDVRKERFRNVARNRSYSVCLVVEGLCDFGNVSATLRSADALGFQSVQLEKVQRRLRYRDNRHVSKGAEKWLDIELWNSTPECFSILKSRGYRIATTHVGMDAVSIYDMDWSFPTAIVVGNENRGISDEALELSDLHCSIPMQGMVDSFNVSVAAGILMHHAVCDRTSRLGCHGDLTLEESQILLAEFSLRHSRSAISIAHQYAKRKAAVFTPNLG
ncbi:tRNA (guanosine(18)-2'-O)-methyltransferase [Morella rubra]|uniref:tRNA (Guanosine(18)-2'-O)-methyltransferase n=1 Tax=Morella rubra TaxID=262757 RepID=A0A6A1VFZ5_9ROSI|nr:tRNA (guanosine(18)-2'-O)-methyltransferase [Morella rubra]